MSSLSSSELDAIRTIGGVATDCSSQDDLRDELLGRVQRAMDAQSGLFFHVSGEAGERPFQDGFSIGLRKEEPRKWRDCYWKMDPFVDHFLRHLKATGQPVCVSSEVISEREYVRSDFYCDFLAPQSVYHVLVAGLIRGGRLAGLIGLHRPRNVAAFSARDVLKMNLLLPYFSAAVEKVELREKLAARQNIIDTLAQDLACSAVLMLDEHLDVVIANGPAIELLGMSAERPVGGAALPEEIRRACARLTGAAGTATGAETDLELRLRGTTMHGFVRASECAAGRPRFIVCFGAGDRKLLLPDRLRKFDLSPREIEVSHYLSQGLTNVQIADRLAISARTVENHLRSVYGKVGVHNRTSLIAHLGGPGTREQQ